MLQSGGAVQADSLHFLGIGAFSVLLGREIPAQAFRFW